MGVGEQLEDVWFVRWFVLLFQVRNGVDGLEGGRGSGHFEAPEWGEFAGLTDGGAGWGVREQERSRRTLGGSWWK